MVDVEAYITKLKGEIEEAYGNKCEQAVEFYSFMSRSLQRRLVRSLNDMEKEAQSYTGNLKAAKKPRMRKVKTIDPVKVVKRLKFLKEFPELHLKSVVPETIVGRTALYMYNTKNGRLYEFLAEDGKDAISKGLPVLKTLI